MLSSVSNAANYNADAVSPGEIVALFGSNLGPASIVTLQVNNGIVTNSLAGTQVLFDGVAAPMVYHAERPGQRGGALRGGGQDEHTGAGPVSERDVEYRDQAGAGGDPGNLLAGLHGRRTGRDSESRILPSTPRAIRRHAAR